MRGLVSLAVRRRVSVIMTALAVVAFGIVGYQRLSIELFPDMSSMMKVEEKVNGLNMAIRMVMWQL